MKTKNCRKIEPIVINDTAGHRKVQECGTCGRWIDQTRTGWRHVDPIA